MIICSLLTLYPESGCEAILRDESIGTTVIELIVAIHVIVAILSAKK